MTLQLLVLAMVMHHSLQLQRQRVMSTRRRGRVIVVVVVVRPPREVAVAMEWRDQAVAVAGAVAGEAGVALVQVEPLYPVPQRSYDAEARGNGDRPCG